MESKERELRDKLAAWVSLTNSEAWKELEAIIKSQVEVRVSTIILTVEADVRVQDFTRGEVSGMKLIQTLVAAIKEELATEIDNCEKES